MQVILNSEQIEQVIDGLAKRIVREMPGETEIAIIGVRSRGEIVAQRLAAKLEQQLKRDIPLGTLDITLYRDDLNSRENGGRFHVRSTEIGFNVDDKAIVLVDDVLYTGRSTRAAMDALIDLGRPRFIRLAVLVDRAGREFPIQADYVGFKSDAGPDEVVHVHLVESDGRDEVVVSR